jgi:hypothetical protein
MKNLIEQLTRLLWVDNMEEKSNSISMSEEVVREEENKKIEEIVRNIIGDDNEAKRLTVAMEDLRKKVGLLPLESPKFEPKTMLEIVIYNMRWNPSFFSDCDILELHEYEMVLCSHIAFLMGRQNKWMSAYKIERQSFDRAVAQVARFSTARSADERKADAISRNETLRQRARTLEIYKLYAEQCDNISDAFIQMDNSLKKMIDTRRIDMEMSKRAK